MRQLARHHSPDIRQIDLDVNRTYRDHDMFRERYNHRQQALFHVLAAYSMYNSEVIDLKSNFINKITNLYSKIKLLCGISF